MTHVFCHAFAEVVGHYHQGGGLRAGEGKKFPTPHPNVIVMQLKSKLQLSTLSKLEWTLD
jgi:hypothetical protein